MASVPLARSRGGAFTRMATMPLSRNTHAISDSVHAVMRPFAAGPRADQLLVRRHGRSDNVEPSSRTRCSAARARRTRRGARAVRRGLTSSAVGRSPAEPGAPLSRGG